MSIFSVQKTNVMGLLYFFETTMELHGEKSQEHVNTCLSTCRAFTESKLGQKGGIKQIWKVRYSLKCSFSKILFLLLNFVFYIAQCLGQIFNAQLTYLHWIQYKNYLHVAVVNGRIQGGEIRHRSWISRCGFPSLKIKERRLNDLIENTNQCREIQSKLICKLIIAQGI